MPEQRWKTRPPKSYTSFLSSHQPQEGPQNVHLLHPQTHISKLPKGWASASDSWIQILAPHPLAM